MVRLGKCQRFLPSRIKKKEKKRKKKILVVSQRGGKKNLLRKGNGQMSLFLPGEKREKGIRQLGCQEKETKGTKESEKKGEDRAGKKGERSA